MITTFEGCNEKELWRGAAATPGRCKQRPSKGKLDSNSKETECGLVPRLVGDAGQTCI